MFPFMANSRARVISQTEGLVKVLGDRVSGKLMGVHILGVGASEMIQEGVLGIALGHRVEEMGKICHGHPTFSEAFK